MTLEARVKALTTEQLRGLVAVNEPSTSEIARSELRERGEPEKRVPAPPKPMLLRCPHCNQERMTDGVTWNDNPEGPGILTVPCPSACQKRDRSGGPGMGDFIVMLWERASLQLATLDLDHWAIVVKPWQGPIPAVSLDVVSGSRRVSCQWTYYEWSRGKELAVHAIEVRLRDMARVGGWPRAEGQEHRHAG